MKKTIKIDSKNSIELSSNMGFVFIYNDTFGTDVLEDVMPMIESLLQLGAIGSLNDDTAVDSAMVMGIVGGLKSVKATTLINVIWAMAKNADESIPNVKDWINQFDKFPLEKVLPDVVDLLSKTLTTRKNS